MRLAALFASATVARAALSPREAVLMAAPSTDRLERRLFDLTRRDHLMASAGDWETAELVRAELEASGFDARIEGVPVMRHLPTGAPRLDAVKGDRVLFAAKLSEPILESDPTSDNRYRNHTFIGYSPSGDVRARLVYANYGMPSDYDALKAAGVDVSGAIVLTRYGGCFRGLKAMNAEARGAVATLIYSDPEDDGFARGPTYPDGPWRPEDGVQRGSGQFLSLCAGDPYRLYLDGPSPCGDVNYVPTRPVLPISYADATLFLESLGGPVAPEAFVGALDLTYTLGPSAYDARLHVETNYSRGVLPNVIATLQGRDGGVHAGTPVYAGNHRDAWVFGSIDPHSGTVVLLEAARALAAVVRETGWQPRRTIVLCSWSGEEYGLIGSTAFSETHDELKNALAYVNVDVAVSGNSTLTAAGTQSLDGLFAGAARDAHVSRGGRDVPLSELWVAADDDEDNKGAIPGVSLLGTLGSGSDYTSMIDVLGIPSIDFSFNDNGSYGTYHSIYDSYAYTTQVVDPGFEHHAAATRLYSLLIYRLADEARVPIAPITESLAITAYVRELAALNASFALDLRPLDAAAEAFAAAAACAERVATAATPATLDAVNERLRTYEKRFLSTGLPDRPWYKHVLQAPGFYLGYGSTSFPGVVHAIEEDDAALAAEQVADAARRVDEAAAYLAEVCA